MDAKKEKEKSVDTYLTFQQKRKTLYSTAITEADEEEELIRDALSHITEIRNIVSINNENKINIPKYTSKST